jgi:type IX secretion system substrate protein
MKNLISFIALAFFFLPNSNAQFFWGKQAVGDAQTSGNDIAADNQGNTFVVGNMDNTITFDGVTVGDVSGNSFEHNYIVKYDPDGVLLWVRTIKGNSNNEVWSVTTDADGNAYVSGTYSHTNSLTILDFGNIQLPGNNSDSGFLAKIDASGNWQWASSLISDDLLGAQHVKPMVIRVLPDGKVLLSGYLQGPVIIDSLTFNNVNDGIQKIFFSGFDEDGNFEWFKHGQGFWGVNAAAPFLELQMDAAGNSYVQCAFNSGATFGTDTLTHTFGGGFAVASFDADANLRWWKNISSSGGEILGGLTLDDEANVYVSAQKTNIIFIGDDVVLDDLLYTLWIFKFDSNGNYISANGVFDDVIGAGGAWTHDIAWHPDGFIIVAGGYEPFFGSPILFGDTLGGGGYRAAFLAAFDTDGNYRGVTEIAYPDGETLGEFLPMDLVTDMEGNLLMTGEFDEVIEVGDFVLTTNLLNQMFTLKIDIVNLLGLTTPVFDIPENGAATFRAFPNPANNYILIESETGKGLLQMVDGSGKVIKTVEIEGKSQWVDLSGLPSGAYYLKLGGSTRQVVVMR